MENVNKSLISVSLTIEQALFIQSLIQKTTIEEGIEVFEIFKEAIREAIEEDKDGGS